MCLTQVFDSFCEWDSHRDEILKFYDLANRFSAKKELGWRDSLGLDIWQGVGSKCPRHVWTLGTYWSISKRHSQLTLVAIAEKLFHLWDVS